MPALIYLTDFQLISKEIGLKLGGQRVNFLAPGTFGGIRYYLEDLG